MIDVNQQTLGEKIKQLRVAKGMTQRRMADGLSVTSSTISNWENNRRSPSIDELKRIARYFETTLAVFDLDESTASHVKTLGQRPLFNQQVIVTPVTPVFTKDTVYLLGLTLIMIGLAVVVGNVLDYLFLASGVLVFIVLLLRLLAQSRHHKKSPDKTLLVPSNHRIVFLTSWDKKLIDTLRTTLKPFALVSIVSLVLLSALSIRTFQALDSMALDAFVILYGIACIATAVFRYIGIAYGGLFRGVADYFRHKERLAIESMTGMVVLDGFGLLGLSTLFLLFRASIIPSYGYLVIFLAVVNILISFGLFFFYKKVTHAQALYAIDEGNRKIPLQAD